ncbi:hypothetical protein [Amycolatopsis saalfeldensis]|nr:hypothetical protein [Amycolatopsis saalfeldensis]
MIVLPGVRLPGLNAARASASGRTEGFDRPSRTRAAMPVSWARSASTTKKTARPPRGWIRGGSAMVTSMPRARPSRVEDRPADHEVGLTGVFGVFAVQAQEGVPAEGERAVPAGGPAGADDPSAELAGELHREPARPNTRCPTVSPGGAVPQLGHDARQLVPGHASRG